VSKEIKGTKGYKEVLVFQGFKGTKVILAHRETRAMLDLKGIRGV
jgi:hypothetical protein